MYVDIYDNRFCRIYECMKRCFKYYYKVFLFLYFFISCSGDI